MRRDSANGSAAGARPPVVLGGVDVREVADCMCLGLRSTARQATQLFDAHLSAAGLTIGQFGVMTNLYGLSLRDDAVSLGALAAAAGLDPTTLNRTLKPLEDDGLVASTRDPADRRTRLLTLTGRGTARLKKALPLWRAADRELQAMLGRPAAQLLGRALTAVHDRVDG